MKTIIRHRVNRISDLDEIDPHWGVEIDLRSDVARPGALHLAHDPWTRGDDFEEWLSVYRRKGIGGPILLNTKEDGLEEAIESALKRFELTHYFFLDTTAPSLVKQLAAGRSDKFLVRFSRFEPLEMVETFAGQVGWIWADCFDGLPLEESALAKLATRFKICLVSPELHGASVSEIRRFAPLMKHAQAVCTKVPPAWLKFL